LSVRHALRALAGLGSHDANERRVTQIKALHIQFLSGGELVSALALIALDGPSPPTSSNENRVRILEARLERVGRRPRETSRALPYPTRVALHSVGEAGASQTGLEDSGFGFSRAKPRARRSV